MLVGIKSYFDGTRFASLSDARAIGLDVLIADLARLGITLKEYLRVLPQAAAPGMPRIIEGGRPE